MGKFGEFCPKAVKDDERAPSQKRTGDTLFSTEKSCRTYKTVLNYVTSDLDKESAFTSVRLDANITYEFVSLQHTTADTKELLRMKTNLPSELFGDDSLRFDTRNPSIRCREGSIPQKSVE